RGLVLFTLVNDPLRHALQEGCRQLQVPAIPVLDPVIGALAAYLGRQSHGVPGRQHLLDSEYFARIDAMTFAINHDDGQSSWGINDADVCLVGVSRTSKTPTCLYLANRGIKAANVPLVPGVPLPSELSRAGMLEAAGVVFTIEPAAIDEARIKVAAREAGQTATACALSLAVEKARTVSQRHPDSLVIGADQILVAGSEWFDKPRDLDEARTQLQALRGRTHALATAVCVTRDGERLWQATSQPELTMRRFTEAFL